MVVKLVFPFENADIETILPSGRLIFNSLAKWNYKHRVKVPKINNKNASVAENLWHFFSILIFIIIILNTMLIDIITFIHSLFLKQISSNMFQIILELILWLDERTWTNIFI